jgi:hypothetical protein
MEINEIPKPWWILPDHFSHRIQFGKRNFTCPSSDFSEFQRVSGFICLMFVYFVYSIDAPPLPVDLRHIAVSEIRVRWSCGNPAWRWQSIPEFGPSRAWRANFWRRRIPGWYGVLWGTNVSWADFGEWIHLKKNGYLNLTVCSKISGRYRCVYLCCGYYTTEIYSDVRILGDWWGFKGMNTMMAC